MDHFVLITKHTWWESCQCFSWYKTFRINCQHLEGERRRRTKFISSHDSTPYQTGIRTGDGWNVSQRSPWCGTSVSEWDPEVGDVSAPCVGQTHREVEGCPVQSRDLQWGDAWCYDERKQKWVYIQMLLRILVTWNSYPIPLTHTHTDYNLSYQHTHICHTFPVSPPCVHFFCTLHSPPFCTAIIFDLIITMCI